MSETIITADDLSVHFPLGGKLFGPKPVVRAVEGVTGKRPDLSTTGGTSDARFIKDFCPVAEFGLISQTMHKVDERVAIADLENLTDIYEAVLDGYFAS